MTATLTSLSSLTVSDINVTDESEDGFSYEQFFSTSSSFVYDTTYPDSGWKVPKRSTSLIVVETLFFALAALVAFLGNCLVVCTVIKIRSLWSIPNALVANLAVTDILMALLNITLAAVVLATGQWPLNDHACQTSAFLNFNMGFCSLLTMTLIALNRYVGVCRPMRYNIVFTTKKTCLYVFTVWLLAAISAMLPLIGWGTYSFEPGKGICLLRWSSSRGFVLFFMSLTIVAPIVILVFCYITIYCALRQSRIRLLGDGNAALEMENQENRLAVPGDSNKNRQKIVREKMKRHREEVRLIKVLVVVFVTFATCWIPVCIINMYEAFTPVTGYRIPRWLDLITIFLVYVSSTCNPFIYGLMNKNYKNGFKMLLCRKGVKIHPLPVGQKVDDAGTNSTPES